MKQIIVFILLAATLPCVVRAQESNTDTPPHITPPAFTVHEWGTFTTLAGSDGVLLPGLYHEEEYLPSFVHNFPGFNSSGYIHKGLYLRCDSVTLKMETPVLYFYSDQPRQVDVRVDWPGGAISQWYPDRADGESIVGKSYLNFGTQHNGWIDWKINVLAPGDTTTVVKDGDTHTWSAPRATDANTITDSAGEAEKFIFYRGVGSASFMDGAVSGQYTLRTSFSGDMLVIDNLSYYKISDALVFQRTDDSVNLVWWNGEIQGGAQVRCHTPNSKGALSFSDGLTKLRDKLVEAGLYLKEANAMLDTWKQSYFGTPGLRVFWIVPRGSTDRSLPLSIDPKPDDLQRVMVARSEVLTPEFEQQLVADYTTSNWNKYYNDRYLEAYQTRVNAIIAASAAGVGRHASSSASIRLYPNPTSGSLTLACAEGGQANIVVINTLGEEVATLFSGEMSVGSHAFDLHIADGSYICLIRMNGREERIPFVLLK